MRVRKRLRTLEAALTKPPPTTAWSDVNKLITKLSNSAANNDLETLLHVQDGALVHPVLSHAEYEKKLETVFKDVKEQFEEVGHTLFTMNQDIVRLIERQDDMPDNDDYSAELIDELTEKLEDTDHRLTSAIAESAKQVDKLQNNEEKVNKIVGPLRSVVTIVYKRSTKTDKRVEKLESQLAEHKKLLKDLVAALTLLGGMED
jgi:chromosome segregation ATPase